MEGGVKGTDSITTEYKNKPAKRSRLEATAFFATAMSDIQMAIVPGRAYQGCTTQSFRPSAEHDTIRR